MFDFRKVFDLRKIFALPKLKIYCNTFTINSVVYHAFSDYKRCFDLEDNNMIYDGCKILMDF